ncbi:MAG: 16S rRNA (guanine(966)-N(2))-methyltransferase RsmD [Lachnospiraceae bacterium]|nr:16S rRNA (guanine(966)-N(2))-methyltransferase RsmD [Lachnospiraceae bacterium]
MRVVAGTARRLPLKTPKGADTRPTTDRIKETLFNILQTDIPDCVFVDLFSGSGGIGIEALSRGARKAYFVDSSSEAAACITENLRFTRLEQSGVVLKRDVFAGLYEIREPRVDLIFMDPPYGKGLERQTLEQLRNMRYVDQDTMIIVEAALATDFSYLLEIGYTISREKIYKTNKHVFIRTGEDAS